MCLVQEGAYILNSKLLVSSNSESLSKISNRKNYCISLRFCTKMCYEKAGTAIEKTIKKPVLVVTHVKDVKYVKLIFLQ